jgi:HEAT repeat protein
MSRLLAALLVLLVSGVRIAAEPTFHGKSFAEWKAQLGKETSEERGRAAMALGLGPFGKKAVPVLINALTDKDTDVLDCVISALGEVGPPAADAVPVLAAVLQRKDAHHRAIYASLGRIVPEKMPAILAQFVDESDFDRHLGDATEAMGLADLPILKIALQHDEPRIRLFAMLQFKKDRDASPLLPALLAILKGETDNQLRHQALQCLRALGSKAEPAIPMLIRSLDIDAERSVAAEVLSKIGKPAFPTLRRILDKGPPSARVALLRSLQPEWDEALPILLRSLKDGDVETRRAAAEGLYFFSLDLGQHIPELRAGLKDHDPAVRELLQTALSCIRPRTDEVVHLHAQGILDPHEGVRKSCVGSFHDYRESSRAAADGVFLTALRDRRAEVRILAARMLHLRSPTNRHAVQGLCDALNDREPPVRWKAAHSLGSLGPEARRIQLASGSSMVDIVVTALQARLQDHDPVVRLCAAIALCRVGYPTDSACRLIASFLVNPSAVFAGSGSDPYDVPDNIQMDGIIALRDSGAKAAAAVPLLIKGLKADNEVVRLFVVVTLKGLGPAARPAVPALATMLEDKDEQIQHAVIEALSCIGGEGVAVLARVLEGKNTDLKCLLCRKVPRESTAAAQLLPRVERLLKDPDEGVRWSAARFLRRMEHRSQALKVVLVGWLKDESAEVRSSAAFQLEGFGAEGAAAIGVRQEELLARNAYSRMSAVRSLPVLDPAGKIVLPSILDKLSERDPEVRAAAVAALGGLGAAGRPALPRVSAALKDSSSEVREAAALALWRITGEKDAALETLRTLYRKEKGLIRVDAVLSMRVIEKKREQLDMLIALLEDEATSARASDVIRSEFNNEVDQVIPALRALTRHRSYAVRHTVWSLLDALIAQQENP